MPGDILKEALKQHFGGLKMFNAEESHHLSRLYNVFVFFFYPEAYHNAIKSKYLKVGPLQLRIGQAYRKQSKKFLNSKIINYSEVCIFDSLIYGAIFLWTTMHVNYALQKKFPICIDIEHICLTCIWWLFSLERPIELLDIYLDP